MDRPLVETRAAFSFEDYREQDYRDCREHRIVEARRLIRYFVLPIL
jgi:hypothetical protein